MSTWSLARGPRVAFVLASVAILVASTLGMAAPASGASPAPESILTPIGHLAPTTLGPGAPATNRPAFAQPFRTLDPGALRAAKLRAAAAASRGSRGPSIKPRTSLAGFFNNLNSPGLNQLTVAPPDSTGAIGPNNYVEMVNQMIGVYDRNLNLIASTDNGTFTGAGASWTVTDPQIQWDGQSGHWLYAALGVATGNNLLIFGWSKTSDPSDLTNGWCRFGTSRGNLLDDYPKLGHDDNFISIGTNVYDDTNAPNYTFLTANIFVIRKPAAGDTSCSVDTVLYTSTAANPLRNADGSIAFTPVPANTADASPFGYVVAAHSPVDGTGSSAPKVMVWHWALVGGAPGLVSDGDVTVPSFDVPAPVPQPGTSYTLDFLDARLTQAVAVNDPGAGGVKGIWTQHTVAGPGGRSVVRWYEILGGAPPTLRQEGDVGSPTDFVFNGAVSPSKGGDSAAVFYNRGGASTLPVIGAQTRSASTPLGSLDAGELLIGQSSAADLDFTCGYSKPTDPCRWGDYAGASPDPLNNGVIWGSSQVTGSCFIFCGFFAQWQTQNFAVVATASVSSAISLAKSAGPTTYNAVGQTITYTYTITNTGNVSLASSQYTVSDDHIGSPLGTAFTCGSPVALAPNGTVGCTKSYAISQADLNTGSVTNRATASGAGLTSNQASATATASVSSAISLAKSAGPTTYNAVGQTITYTYTITNTGNVSLASSQYTVSDDHIGSPLGTAFTCGSPVALAPNGTVGCTKSYAISQADLNAGSVTNRATASGAGLTSNQASATATASVTSAISLAKSASPMTYNAVGQTITYTYTITNTGNVSLASSQYTVSDDHIGSPLGTAFTCGSPVALAPNGTVGCTKSYAISQADLNTGSVTNRATASGAGLTSNQASATATASVSSAISLAKSAGPTTYNAVGQTITYTYTITNTGNVSLASSQYTVSDDHIGSPLGTAFTCGSPVALAPNGTVGCTKSYAISQADLNTGSVTNRATASGAGLTSNQASATATASVSSAISLAKSAGPTTYNAVGQTITYTYTITNTGNVSLASSQYTVSDDHIGSPLGTAFTCGSPVALAPNGTVGCTKSYAISQADLNTGSVTNRATASGAGLTSNQASATATASVTPPSAPENLTAVPAKGKGIQLAWQAPSASGSSPITGYRVYRGTGTNPASFGLITTLALVTSYKDTKPTRGSTYTYYVVAVSAAGPSIPSNWATTTAR